MSLDDVFDEAQKRRSRLARNEAERAEKKIANKKAGLEKQRTNATHINNWLRFAHNHFMAKHYSSIKANGYDVQHQYRLTATIPGQTYDRLSLFMNRGGVIHVFESKGLGYEADHALVMSGNEMSGEIKASFISRIGNVNEELGSFDAAAPPDSTRLDSMFERFVKRSLELEDWQRGRSTSP
jgi:hypothetical protein